MHDGMCVSRSSALPGGDTRRGSRMLMRRPIVALLLLLAAPSQLLAADASSDTALMSSSLRDAAPPFLRALEISGANGMKSVLQQGDVFLQHPKLMRLYSNLGSNDWTATLLWPSDVALDKLARGAGCTRDYAVAALTHQPELFWAVLSAHIIEGTVVFTSNFTMTQQFQALDGGMLVPRKDASGHWLVNGASISQPDIQAGKAVLHVVDALVQPAGQEVWQQALSCSESGGGTALPPGARIGISVGVSMGLVLLLMLALLATVMVRRRRRQQHAQDLWAAGGAPKTVVAAAAAASASRWRRSRGVLWRVRRACEQVLLPCHHKDALGVTVSHSTAHSSSDGSVQQQVHVVCGSNGINAAGSAGDTVLCVMGSGVLIAPIPLKEGDESSDDGEHAAEARLCKVAREQCTAAAAATAGGVSAAAFGGCNERTQQGVGGSLHPALPGSLLPQPHNPEPAALTPAVTEEQLAAFLAQWESAGSAGGRALPILPLFSDVVPPADAGASAVTADEMEQLYGCFAAVQATGGMQETTPLLQHVLADLNSGRHPVTHNFSMDEQQAPIARPNTAVMFAHNNNNHKRVCIKFFAPRSPGYRAETSAYYRLASRHLPFLEATFTDKDGSYASALVMEAGERSLQELLAERRPTDLPRKVELLHQLVSDLRAMHSNNMVHRQLHPRHVVFYSDSLSWKLIDFSASVSANTMVMPEVFSLEYTAPEVAAAVVRGDRGVVACTASDMWSLGVIAYEVATGQPFWPLTWSNEDIWRALLGLAPLPSERADMAAAAAPGEKAFMKKVASLLQRDPCKRMGAERLATSRLFSVCAATTTNVPLHAMQQQQLAGSGSGSNGGESAGSELFRRLGSINRTLERLGLQVDRGNSLGANILKELTMNSLILSVNLHELRPHSPLGAQATPCKGGSRGAPAESVPDEELGGGAKLCAVQVGALGLVAKSPAPLVDDGSSSPVFYLRQGSTYLLELTIMHAKGQPLPDQASVESCVIESPDGRSMPLQLGPTCRGRSQLMVSAVFNPAASRSKLVSGVTPRRLWGRREASVPLSLSICLSMCLLPDAAPVQPPACGGADVSRMGSCASMASAAGSSSMFGGSSAASFARRVSSSASRSVTSGPSASSTSYHSCLSAQQQQQQALSGACSQLEQAWVQTELAVRVFPADASFKAVRTFRYLDECWQALPPEARNMMQGLVLLVRGAAGGAAALASVIR